MIDYEKFTELLQWHLGVEFFNYNPVIDWAIYMIQQGRETETMLILASFSKPVYREEIRPYVSRTLVELNLEEKVGSYSVISNCYFHVSQIIGKNNIKDNLSSLYIIHTDNDYPKITRQFYALYWAWSDLLHYEFNHYYQGVTLKNMETVLELECHKFIAHYIDKDDIKVKNINRNIEEIILQKPKIKSTWDKIRRLFS